MLEIISTGVNIIVVLVVLFFVILWYLCAMWAKAHPDKYPIIGLLVSSIFSFRFLVRAFLIILLLSVLWQIKEQMVPLISILSFWGI